MSAAFLGALAFVGVGPASAVVYNPATAGLPGTTATAGFIDSWFIPQNLIGVGPPPVPNPDWPANQDPSTIEALVEGLTGLDATLVANGAANCGQAGFSCNGNVGTSDLLASIFAVHLGGGELVFLYPNAISNFSVTLGFNPDIQQGLGLSNIRAYTAVPVPPAALLLLSGLAVLFGWSRRKAKAA